VLTLSYVIIPYHTMLYHTIPKSYNNIRF